MMSEKIQDCVLRAWQPLCDLNYKYVTCFVIKSASNHVPWNLLNAYLGVRVVKFGFCWFLNFLSSRNQKYIFERK